jgi:putative hydrolase of HD superfamily
LVQSKKKKEREAINKIFLSLSKEGDEYTKLFDEFEEDKTTEARFVKQLDKLEMAIQVYEYESKHGLDLEEFYTTARTKIKDKKLVAILNELEKMRSKR